MNRYRRTWDNRKASLIMQRRAQDEIAARLRAIEISVKNQTRKRD